MRLELLETGTIHQILLLRWSFDGSLHLDLWGRHCLEISHFII
jgi:hypothetical protein